MDKSDVREVQQQQQIQDLSLRDQTPLEAAQAYFQCGPGSVTIGPISADELTSPLTSMELARDKSHEDCGTGREKIL